MSNSQDVDIIINGHKLNVGQVDTLRLALATFHSAMRERDGLGDGCSVLQQTYVRTSQELVHLIGLA